LTEKNVIYGGKNVVFGGKKVTCRIVTSVLESVESVDQGLQDLLPGLRGQVVEIGENT